MTKYFIKDKKSGFVYSYDTDVSEWERYKKEPVEVSQIPTYVFGEMVKAAGKGNILKESEVGEN